MATLNAPSLVNQPPISGVGNANVVFGKVTLAAAAVGDVVRLGVIPAGAKVYSVRMVEAILGASITSAFGYAPVEGSTPTADADKFSNDTTIANSAATNTTYNGAPIQFDNDVYLTLTIGGSGTATGAVDVIVEYEFTGLK